MIMVSLVDLADEPITCDCGAELKPLELVAIVVEPGPYPTARVGCLECLRLELLAARARRDTDRALPIGANLDELERG